MDATSLREALGDSAQVNMIVNGAALVTSGRDTTPHVTQVTGVLARVPQMADSLLLAGRIFTDAEATSGAPLAVISGAVSSNPLAVPVCVAGR